MKYIIEIAKEYEEYFKGILICGIAEGKFAVDVIAKEDLEELNSDYINEHYGDLQDDAYERGHGIGYQKGFEDGKKSTFGLVAVADVSNAEYQRGLDDAWEAARKIVKMPDPPYWGVFDEYKDDLFRKITATEAIAKLKAYEEKQQTDNCIEIGDEVEWDGDKYIVTYRNMDINTGVIQDYDLMMWDGSVVDHVKKCSFVKTGNHYDISSILKEMQSQ